MANNLIPEELDALIQQYLTDGVLTDKERQVILKKADKMGLDRDEVDLYLDAEIQKIDQTTDAAVRKQKGKVCPYCGASIPLLADKCPACERFITPEASKELQDILDNLEGALVDMKSLQDIINNKKEKEKWQHKKATVERYSRQAKLYYSNNPKIKILLDEIENEVKNTDKKIQKEKKGKTIKICLAIISMLLGFIIVGIAYEIDSEGFAYVGFMIALISMLIAMILST